MIEYKLKPFRSIILVLIENIFCEIDDFCKEFYPNQSYRILPNPNRKRIRYCKMASSEIMTIIILFHLSYYRTLDLFPNSTPDGNCGDAVDAQVLTYFMYAAALCFVYSSHLLIMNEFRKRSI
ncbi:IS982 family transposase domain protein [Rickettsiales endosymbiont of Paramecium tredecaurelia]|nr:IS982 family transposase domain protein [Candidatus Sarmatiella mevalonica]